MTTLRRGPGGWGRVAADVRLVPLAGDVVLAAPGIELVALDFPPNIPS